MAALILLCDKDSWEELRSEYDQILRARRREPHSGLCKGATCEKAKLARLAIAFVPNTVYNHWFEHGKAAMVGIQEIFGTDLDIQVIKGNVARGTIQEIYETGKPTFWIVSQTSESLNILRKTPSFGYAVRIYDELNVKARSKYDQQESQAIFNYVVSCVAACTYPHTANPHWSLVPFADPGHDRGAQAGHLRSAAPAAPPGARRQLCAHQRGVQGGWSGGQVPQGAAGSGAPVQAPAVCRSRVPSPAGRRRRAVQHALGHGGAAPAAARVDPQRSLHGLGHGSSDASAAGRQHDGNGRA